METTTETGKPLSKKRLPLEDFFKLVCSFKNAVDWVQAPNGSALIKFISEKSGICQVATTKKIDELAELRYIQKEFYGKKKKILWRVKILIKEWDPKILEKKQEEDRAAKIPIAVAPQTKQVTPSEKKTLQPPRRFAIFMDFVNLEKNLQRSADKFSDFSWLLNPILKQGKIIFAFVFIPDHYVSRAPIMQLTHKHHFHAIFCPRQINGVITKDVDTVDAQMQELAWALIEHSDITDVIIISGDADFHSLATRATWQQKKVKIVSARDAISGRFMGSEQDGFLSVQLV